MRRLAQRWLEEGEAEGEVEVQPWREGGGRVEACLAGSGKERGGSRGRAGSRGEGGRRPPSSGPGLFSGRRWDKMDLDTVDLCKGQRLKRGWGDRRVSKVSRGKCLGNPEPSRGLPSRWEVGEVEPWKVGMGRW